MLFLALSLCVAELEAKVAGLEAKDAELEAKVAGLEAKFGDFIQMFENEKSKEVSQKAAVDATAEDAKDEPDAVAEDVEDSDTTAEDAPAAAAEDVAEETGIFGVNVDLNTNVLKQVRVALQWLNTDHLLDEGLWRVSGSNREVMQLRAVTDEQAAFPLDQIESSALMTSLLVKFLQQVNK